MFTSLQNKIFSIITVVLLLTVGTSIVITSTIFKYELSNALTHEVSVVGESLKLQLQRLLTLEIPLNELVGFEDQCQEIIEKYPNISYAEVVTPDGKILFHSNTPFHSQRITSPKLLAAIKTGKDDVVEYNENGHKFYASLIMFSDDSGDLLGAIVLGLPEKIVHSKVTALTSYSLVISLFFLITSFILIALAIAKWVTKPLTALDKATKTIIETGPESFIAIPIKSNDEIGRLAHSFNQMADELQKTTVSKTYMNNIIFSINDALFVTDLNLVIRTINRASGKLVHYSEDELINQPLTILFDTNQPFPHEKEGAPLLNIETAVLTKDGDKIPVLMNCSFIKELNGKIKSLVVTMKDITDRKQSEEALLAQTQKLSHSNAALQEFAYIASHDLQEPLRKIIAFNERIMTKLNPILDEQTHDYLTRVQEASKRMQKLIYNLLMYSRVTTQAQPFEPVNLASIAAEVISDLQLRIEQTNAQIEMGELPEIEADPTQMHQLFQNLIGNALKYHRAEATPLVKIYANKLFPESPGYHWQANAVQYELIFEDNGIGIEEQYHQRIFGVFQRLHGRGDYEGTGIGLAICQKIAERHNGKIRVESVVGEGTKFILTLPSKQVKQD